MRILTPRTVTDGALVLSNVPENDAPAWAAGATYALGAQVMTGHRLYESAIAGNLGHDPAAGGSSWIDAGPTNRWAMFDQAPVTRTSRSYFLRAIVSPPSVWDAVALLDVDAESVHVIVTANGATLYDEQQDAIADGVLRSAIVFADLPYVAGAQVDVRVSAATGAQASLGTLLIGRVTDLGTTESGPTLSLTDFSRRETDDFGATTVVQRAYAKRVTARSLVDSSRVDAVQQRLATVRALPVLWIGEGFDCLTVYGFYKDFSIDLQLGATSYCSLTIEGLPAGEVPIAVVDPAVEGASDLRVLRPVPVTDAVLTASNVPETDATAWSADTVYAAGARVQRAPAHRIFESLVSANIDNDPLAGTGEWLDAAPTNRWAMFDQALGTVTAAAGSVVVTLTPGEPITALALLDVAAASVRVQAPGYDRTIVPDGGALTFLDLVAAAGAAITVTFAGPGTSVGTLMLGRLEPLGRIETSPTVSIADYSRKETDEFGVTVPVQRAWAKRMVARAQVRSEAVDGLFRRLAGLRTTPALWIGQDGFDSLTIYGFYRDASVDVGERTSTLGLTIEGLSTAAEAPAYPLGVQPWPDIPDPDGTKPDDNADVTGENTSADTNAVGGRGSSTVLGTIDTTVSSILEQALRQDDLDQVFDARTLVEGQPVGVQFLSFRDAQQTTNAAVATSLGLLGAKSPDGTAWIMNLQTVRVGPVTLAGRFGGLDQSITDIGINIFDLGLGLDDLTTQVGVLTTNLTELGADYGDTAAQLVTLQQAFATEQQAVATSFALLGAATPNGQGWALSLQNVLVGDVSLGTRLADFDQTFGEVDGRITGVSQDVTAVDGRVTGVAQDLADLAGDVGTLSTDLTELGAEYGDTKSSVTALEEAFATDSGGYARFSLRGKVDPGTGKVNIVGVDGIATTNSSELNFYADAFNFVSEEGGEPVRPFAIVGNSVHATNFMADSITYGALVYRFADVGQQNLDPAGWYQVLPGGLIMQGGQYRGEIGEEVTFNVTFPKPFLSAVLSVGAMPYISTFTDTRDLWLQNVGDPTLYGAVFATQAATKNNRTLDGFDWFAWGR